MKNLSSLTICMLSLAFASQAQQSQKVTLSPLWQSDTTLTTPESVLHDPRTNVLYVACINGQPQAGNNKSFISKVDQQGKVLQLKFTEGLNATKGLGISGNSLYVTELTNIVQIDLGTGKVIKRYPVKDAKFLNDIDVDSKTNTVYVSDSGTGKVWAIKNGVLSLTIEGGELKGINGLLVEKNQLLIGNGDGSLLSMNLSTRKLKTIGKVSGGIDGIAALGANSYIVSEWGGKVWHINAAGKTDLLIDSTKEKINTADLTYNPKTKVLFVPTFFHNKVMAYRVK